MSGSGVPIFRCVLIDPKPKDIMFSEGRVFDSRNIVSLTWNELDLVDWAEWTAHGFFIRCLPTQLITATTILNLDRVRV